MCGIFFSLTPAENPVLLDKNLRYLLTKRGPDEGSYSIGVRGARLNLFNHEGSGRIWLSFASTVLSMRGDDIVRQPLTDSGKTGSILAWNGDAWKIAGQPFPERNDTEIVFNHLLQATTRDYLSEDYNEVPDSTQRVTEAISKITGPFAFVFYDAVNFKLYFGRDCLGRRSLLWGLDEAGNLKICSLCDGVSSSSYFQEVEADGVYMVEFEDDQDAALEPTRAIAPLRFDAGNIKRVPWSNGALPIYHMISPIPPMNKATPKGEPPPLTTTSSILRELEYRLRKSLALRIQNVRRPPFARDTIKIGVLFSGGLDCTLLARLAHDILPEEESVDLLNVAFENPRVVAAAARGSGSSLSAYESCPDRVTGRAAFAELQRVCPTRNWRFVAIDIPYVVTVTHRDTVKRLMRPHNTEMDLSIACALYFAARGQGTAIDSRRRVTKPYPYKTPARVLLSGLGADELFAGYARHGIAFSRKGFKGLIDEIDLDVSRLGKRNLGRDNRVIAHWGREARFPFLDEDFVAWVVQTPVWEKCGFGVPEPSPADAGIDPEKKVLRLLTLKLGLSNTAREKKRAIQFGSRTAKMEKGKTKGTDTLS
ncbi:asparagine synthetase domain-containing protein [Aspergillus lucknowensis]|uniref:Asparagine synthase-domain-containing protein n=1 Tax=Aspergillus lucknowensis TaxID=176173 RepID=A0ABR4LLT6_9EURO